MKAIPNSQALRQDSLALCRIGSLAHSRRACVILLQDDPLQPRVVRSRTVCLSFAVQLAVAVIDSGHLFVRCSRFWFFYLFVLGVLTAGGGLALDRLIATEESNASSASMAAGIPLSRSSRTSPNSAADDARNGMNKKRQTRRVLLHYLCHSPGHRHQNGRVPGRVPERVDDDWVFVPTDVY